MDLLRYRWIISDFTWGAWVDSLARCSWDGFVFDHHCYLVDWVSQMSTILCTLRFAFRWATIYTLWDLPFEICRQSSFSDIESSFNFDFSEVCCDVFGSWPIDFNRWFIYRLFQQCEHPGYWGIFPFLISVVRPLTFWVGGFKSIYFMPTFELVFSIIPFFRPWAS